MKAKPILKWIRGKSQLLSQFNDYYSAELRNGKITKYFEPFIGGGAVLFDVLHRFNIETAFISDINKDLILVYKTVKLLPDGLLEQLEKHQKEFDNTLFEDRNELYLKRREEFN